MIFPAIMTPLSTHNNRLGVFFLFSLLFFISCEDSFGTDNSFNPDTTILVNQRELEIFSLDYGSVFKEIKQRIQITDLQVTKGSCDIRFQDGKIFRFPNNIFPVIQADATGHWTISGYSTDIEIKKNAEGEIISPYVAIGEDGYWSLDSLHTDFHAKRYQDFLQKYGNDSLNVNGLLVYRDTLYVYLSNDSKCRYTVTRDIFYQIPDYWRDHLVEKEHMAEAAIKEADGDYASFVFFTDAHWGKNMRRSPALIRHIIDFTPINDVLFGGDVITTHSTNIVDPIVLGLNFQASFAFLGTKFHCLYGNHDNNSDGQPGKPEYHLSEEQVYAWLQSQMTDVVYGDYFNFYYDNPASKTRIICLDTGRYYYSIFRNTLPKTVSFAIDALSSLPDGWHAIMASHIWCNLSKQSDGTYKQYLESYIKSILTLFDHYNARQAGNFVYKNQKIPYSFSSAKGKVEFCIGGHTHGEYTTFSEKGIPIIIISSDYSKNPQAGTSQEQSVSMTIIDYKNKKLSIYSVGRGTDRFFDL